MATPQTITQKILKAFTAERSDDISMIQGCISVDQELTLINCFNQGAPDIPPNTILKIPIGRHEYNLIYLCYDTNKVPWILRFSLGECMACVLAKHYVEYIIHVYDSL